MTDDLLTRREVAGLLGVSAKTVMRYEAAGLLDARRIGPWLIRITSESVAALTRSRQEASEEVAQPAQHLGEPFAAALAGQLYEWYLGWAAGRYARNAFPGTPEEAAADFVPAFLAAITTGLSEWNQRMGWRDDDPRWSDPAAVLTGQSVPVQPGDVLVIRAPRCWRVPEVEQMQELLDAWLKANQPASAAIVVPGDELNVEKRVT